MKKLPAQDWSISMDLYDDEYIYDFLYNVTMKKLEIEISIKEKTACKSGYYFKRAKCIKELTIDVDGIGILEEESLTKLITELRESLIFQ